MEINLIRLNTESAVEKDQKWQKRMYLALGVIT